jgi:hypothetical protein
MSERQVNM